MYGGLGKVGLDHQGTINDEGESKQEVEVPGFSESALKYVKKVKVIKEDEDECIDEDLLLSDLEDMNQELEKIDEEIKEEEEEDMHDKAQYPIQQTDEGYRKILKEKFGFDDFLEGQLDAIKMLLNKKENALVVLATGGGKSLIYQYVSLFLPGLVIIVTPLISLMTDQLNKIPSFMTGACLNSQQNYTLKK